MPGPLKYRTKIVRWGRKCPSGSVEETTDAHDLINVISSLLSMVLCLKHVSSSVRGESKCALCIICEKCVNGWENLACHCLCDAWRPDTPLCAASHVNIPSTMFVLEGVP